MNHLDVAHEVAQQSAEIPIQAALSLLVVSYYFAPNAEVGGRRIERFCRHLPEFGIRPIVLTIDPPSCATIDISLQPDDALRIERVPPDTTLLKRYHDWATKRNTGQISGIEAASDKDVSNSTGTSSLRKQLLAILQFPDTQRGWHKPAVKHAKRVLANQRIDAVLSSGPPWTSHAVAHSISRRFSLPWIADFRDGWASDPWRDGSNQISRLPAWRDKLDHWTEGRWMRQAARVICTTNQLREAMLRSHPSIDRHRVITLSNGFDKQDRKPIDDGRKNGPRLLLHAGSLYAGRRIGPFCKAVQFLAASGAISAVDTRIVLVGDMDSDIEREAHLEAADIIRSGTIVIRPRVDWKQARQMVDEADVLLIFQGHHPTAIPAKFYEYLQTGKPILAIAGHGALRDIVLSTGSGFVADPDDTASIAKSLEEVLRMRIRSAEQIERSVQPYGAKTLTSELAANIRAVISN